jgi:hypothetical protein
MTRGRTKNMSDRDFMRIALAVILIIVLVWLLQGGRL